MENALALAAIIGPVYLVIGLSLLFYAKSWHHLIDRWAKDHFQLFPLMLMELVLGIIIIRMYNVWAWNIWLLITLTGWCMFVKGTYYMLVPGSWITPLLERKAGMNGLYFGGVIMGVIGAVLSYYVYFV